MADGLPPSAARHEPPATMTKLLVVQTAALGHDFAATHGLDVLAGLPLRTVGSTFPAVTCTASATFRTGLAPMRHGVTANGWLDRSLREPCFWKQPAGLVEGPRIWDGFRARGGTVAVGFVQQSLGERADAIVSPAPIHKHGGGMVMSCSSTPSEFYRTLRAANPAEFRLWQYWGPLASPASSRWIARGFARYLSTPAAADLVWCYLPGLDYDLQRFGPSSREAALAAAALEDDLRLLASAADANGYGLVVFGDYAMEDVTVGPVHPNRALAAAGLLRTREVGGLLYPDLYASDAFAVCDHQIAAVEVFDAARLDEAVEVCRALPGVEQVLVGAERALSGLDHPHAGQMTLIARPGAWFAYPWWMDDRRAPDYARHVDIHNKPGFDPCELFFGWPNPFHSSLDVRRVKGTHGRAGAPCALFSTLTDTDFAALADLSAAVKAALR